MESDSVSGSGAGQVFVIVEKGREEAAKGFLRDKLGCPEAAIQVGSSSDGDAECEITVTCKDVDLVERAYKAVGEGRVPGHRMAYFPPGPGPFDAPRILEAQALRQERRNLLASLPKLSATPSEIRSQRLTRVRPTG